MLQADGGDIELVDVGDDGIVKVQLAGANPDVLEGHPFNFNIALESDFDRLAKLVTEGLAAADTVLFNAAEGAAR